MIETRSNPADLSVFVRLFLAYMTVSVSPALIINHEKLTF